MVFCYICNGDASQSGTICTLCNLLIDVKCHGGTIGDGYVVCRNCCGVTSPNSFIEKDKIVANAFQQFTKSLIEEVASSRALKLIFSGERYSYRHNLFKKGGAAKKTMSDVPLLDLLSEKQADILSAAMGKNFQFKFNNYVYKVLMPEAIIQMFAKVQGWSQIYSEVFLNTYINERDKKEDIVETSFSSDQCSESDCEDSFQNMIETQRKEAELKKVENLKRWSEYLKPSTSGKSILAKDVWKMVNNQKDDSIQCNRKLKRSFVETNETLSSLRNTDKGFQSDIISGLEEEIEILQSKLKKAERAAEREYMSDSSNQSLINTNKTIKITQKKDFQNLFKKRKDEQNRKKVRACLEKYVGSSETVKSRNAKNNCRVFDIICPDCEVKQTRLSNHLISKHQFSKDDASLKESELRVLFLWAQKNKHGVAKPLPCLLCFKWHLRLDSHLRNKHKMNKDQIVKVTSEARQKYWLFDCINQSSSCTQLDRNIEKELKSTENTNSEKYQSFLTYTPIGAKRISKEKMIEWDIQNENFSLCYENASDLLDGFKSELSKRHPISRALAYRNHVESIWFVIDGQMNIYPKSAFSNVLLVEDIYHNPSVTQVNNGGNEASSLRVKFVALRLFLKFSLRRHVFIGLKREDINNLREYMEEWNSDLTKPIAQRKTDIRKIKLKRLMTPSHMIKYGRSVHVQGIIKSLNKKINCNDNKLKLTKRFSQQVRDYLIANICIMNGLRASNIIELRTQDVFDATTNPEYPGYKVFVNSTYKTSTIYGEKVIALPIDIFKHLEFYIKELLPILNQSEASFLFISSDAEKMTHGAIGSALTSTFRQALVFGATEYPRVCPTRIRCSCATFGCKSEGIDSGYFAKHFMKNKEDTTQIHYNLFSNHREALKLAMMVGNTFEVGDFKKVLEKNEIEDLTNSIYAGEKNIPSKEHIVEWLNLKENVGSKEMSEIMNILKETENNTSSFYANNIQAESSKDLSLDEHSDSDMSSVSCNKDELTINGSSNHLMRIDRNEDYIALSDSEPTILGDRKSLVCCKTKIYPKRNRKSRFDIDVLEEQKEEKENFELEILKPDVLLPSGILRTSNPKSTNLNLDAKIETILQKFDVTHKDDLVKGRKHRKSLFLILTQLCEKLITRRDYENIYKTRTFTAEEVKACLSKESWAEAIFQSNDEHFWKFLVLNICQKRATCIANNQIYKLKKWTDDSKKLFSCLKNIT
ncbi:uncharacterized protein LOC105844710 isoform X2 [Hydra vulgaris]|uniref:uncharacterized protein LOC105844710 isoform X2 n=1 Tax=Hydra vulgaris TaxID=6087 RepID=UPI0032EA0DED